MTPRARAILRPGHRASSLLAWPLLTFVVLAPAPTEITAQSWAPRAIAELLANPSRYADQEVVVEGVVRGSRWQIMTIPGPPPRQDLVPVFLLADGNVGLWVVVLGGPANSSSLGAPAVGTPVRVYGTFRAGTRSIETDRGITIR